MMEGRDIPLEGEVVKELSRGIMYASLAITDNKEGTLKNIKRANPWQQEVLRVITGSKEAAHKPLKEMLFDHMDGMIWDYDIDVSGVTKGGHFLDTQGYIAHDDERVVLAFRCTTSAFDWLTNLNTTSSAWEIEEDLAQGFSGFCSGFDDLCCVNPEEYKPRVHTGFYNNFLAALPSIKEHVEPLLGKDSKPRKLYIVGHSLGAGVATLAACYFLTEYDWNELPHRLVVVTAGSPRACCDSMKTVINDRRHAFGSNAHMYRVVKGTDVVTTVPPEILGFRHLADPILITDDEKIMLCIEKDDPGSELIKNPSKSIGFEELASQQEESDDEADEGNRRYDRVVAKIPKPFRDHMPDFYLKPILKAMGLKYGSTQPCIERDLSKPEQGGKAANEEEGETKTFEKEKSGRKWKTFGKRIFGERRQKSTRVKPVASF